MVRIALTALGIVCLVTWAHGDGCFMEPVDIDARAEGKTAVASTEQKGVIIELPEGREALLLQVGKNNITV